MYVLQTRLRNLVLIRQTVSHGLSVQRRIALGYYSTSSRRLEEAREVLMFKKAVKDHSVGSAKPLQSSILRPNGVVPPKPTAQTPQSIGVKRKSEMTAAGDSTLGSLHSVVYFDENDFDSDGELDLEAPDPVICPSKVIPSNVSTQASAGYSNSNGASMLNSVPAKEQSSTGDNDLLEIKYPELPPIPDDDVVPSSSIQYPWSSSPPSHLQPPQPMPPPPQSGKSRTLPWLKDEKREEPNRHMRPPSTPARSKPTLPWNKTASAIKEEQKELRREYKKSQEGDANSKQRQPRARLASLFLSDEQRAVLEAVVDQGKSIFFTGSAGTGKSVLMREIIKKLRDRYRREPDRVAVTASTGLAACNIEGVTLHSFAGIGLGKDAAPELVKKVISITKPSIRINSL